MTASTPRITFAMRTNLALRANFIPNPFAPVNGSYAGLGYESNGVVQSTSGFLAVSIRDSGAYSAKLQFGGRRYSLSGRLSLNGHASKTVARVGMDPIEVELQVDLLSAEQLTGRVSDGTWSAKFIADKAVFNARTNPCPFTGSYTLAVLGGPDARAQPAGNSVGELSISAGGLVLLKGSLADGTRFIQRVAVSRAGYWPLYAALYANRGSILAWLHVQDQAQSDLDGNVSWIKPEAPGSLRYPDGFSWVAPAIGSHYTPPLSSTTRALLMTNAQVSFGESDLGPGFTNQVSLLPNNSFINISSNKLTLSLAKRTGHVSGKVTAPGTASSRSFQAVALQKQNLVLGYFLGPSSSGSVVLENQAVEP